MADFANLSGMAIKSIIIAAFALVCGLMTPAPASAFACYVGLPPDGPVILRKSAGDKAKAIKPLDQYDMVTEIPAVRERNGWVKVFWYKTLMSDPHFARKDRDGRGWIRRDQIRGECED